MTAQWYQVAQCIVVCVLLVAPRVGSSGSSLTCSASDRESGACSIDYAPEVSLWTLRRGRLEIALERTVNGSLAWHHAHWLPRDHGDPGSVVKPCNQLQLGPIFEVAMRNSRRIFDSNSCKLSSDSVVNASADSLGALFLCPIGLQVRWRISMSEISLPTENSEVGDVVGAAARIEIVLTGPDKAAPRRLSLLSLTDIGECKDDPDIPESQSVLSAGKVDGSPVIAQGRFFLALEHPLAKNDINASTLPANRRFDARVEHLGTRSWGGHSSASKGPLSIFRYTATIGAFAEPSQARRVFLAYLQSVRLETAWKGPLVHYNSWYDFTSWQDEGFFSPRRARNKQEAQYMKKFLKELQKDQMHEQSAIQVVKAYGEELVRKRSALVDSFLWDDGWDDSEEDLWAFDRERFPNGFAPVAKVAKEYGCGNGVWLSPWGGYGTAKDNRIAAAKAQGFETNENGLSLAGPRYFQRFKQAAITFRREGGVNFFKIDGVAGDPAEVAAEIEAMLGISAELHTTGDGEIWINLTTGTWPSPFFLLWVDSIWRGHTDTQLVDERSLPGTTNRQRWHAFRECIVHEFIVKRAPLFPIARLMIHGVVLAQHGDARSHGLNEATELDWAQEVWSFASMGLLLQELYVSPELMTGPRWDVLAEALVWIRNNSRVLEDTRWAFPAGCVDGSFRPHGWAAWRGSTGFLTLRNLQAAREAESPSFTLTDALELAVSAKRGPLGEPRSFRVSVVKRFANQESEAVRSGKPCAFLVGSESSGKDGCVLTAATETRVKLGRGELLILRVSLLPLPS